ncbi:hypothetical protein K505DRAFT_380362 [Melanomma pulvis-pyrius CBS 109.77]|uniref:F-box domain-containing protein n=1 Tax=Melanomma pulvis-pyrius CBS 109.77 TaxID=1314802 RepID=A0A6A6WR50_9PLEO|nr:hypothetical protein K505DRAFT_380362 [Melanomma pulvis-pyrius CBS 109.77]
MGPRTSDWLFKEVSRNGEVDVTLADELITMLPNVRCVKIAPEYHANSWRYAASTESFMQKIFHHCTRLKHIYLSGIHDPQFERIMKDTCRFLQILEIAALLADTYTQTKPENPRTAAFTTLRIQSVFTFSDNLYALQHLLLWPIRLERFALHTINNRRGPYMPITMLEPFKHCLSEIELYPRDPDRTPFSFSDFSKLETLRLTWTNVKESSVLEAPWHLLPPRLRTLGWVFTGVDAGDDPEEVWEVFHLIVEVWTRKLVQAALAKDIPLREVEMIFFPNLVLEFAPTHHEYPWDQIKRLEEKLIGDGVCVVYDTPSITKEEWLTHGSNTPSP